MNKLFLCACCAAASLCASAAEAAVTLNIVQSGSDVVATVNGSIDTAGLSPFQTGVLNANLTSPSQGFIGLGVGTVDLYALGFTGPASWGPGVITDASSTAGSAFVISASVGGVPPRVYVPTGYVSGSPISATESFLGQTFASLGMTPGTYVYTSRAGDTVTVNIGSAVPEPVTWAMMLVGFGAIGLVTRRPRKRELRTA